MQHSTPRETETIVIEHALVPAALGEMVVIDDGPLWMAWDLAKQRWLDGLEARSGRKNTRKAYECALSQFFRFCQAPPWQIRANLAHDWVASLREQGLAESTVALKLAALSSFYRFCQIKYTFRTPDGRDQTLWPADQVNPFQTVDRPSINPYGRAKFPTTDEVRAILDCINTSCLRGKRDLALLYTIFTTCRRFSEIVNLRWGDIQPRPDGDYNFRYVYKGGKPRRAKLHRTCYRAICAYLVADGRPPESLQDDDAIFVPINPELALRLPTVDQVAGNQPISNTQANRILKKYARRAGVDPARAHIHGLRHAGARLRRQQMSESGRGVDYEELMLILGHSSIATTQIYSQTVLEDPEDKGVDAVIAATLPRGRPRRRARAVPPEQGSFLGGIKHDETL